MKKLLIIIIALLPLNVFASEGLEGSLSVGEIAADFSLPNPDGENISLYEELAKGPVVVSFYRGGWCPVCNRQLQEFQVNLSKIEEAGAKLIAISPETPSNSEKTAVKNLLKFEVLSDKGNELARKYGIIWQVPESDREGFSEWLKSTTGQTLEEFNNHEGYELPVPATFVIGRDKIVKYAFKDIDYKKRADINEVLEILENLN
ncbi:MAG: peroxiredoxin-like family protein [Rickettsiales bacterium]|nr:peroxiredoxin-like family protein [Pseudomonadota bacterium]MDA0965968.1 peroxiredoxin-like family protein [Pseudomonadota bacterium]MDG4542561.1 peroxiredoxin-like family protein [Rickettsiales bacterium]MDG4545065.1 peroxiredoxin-like family protein [Rickettsiales bacterium]MDG4547188.1 peroxiredoxin-like family protein [Rickettsiales bacterium]